MKKLICLLIILFVFSCDSPFNTKTDEKDIFELDIVHNIERVMPSANVLLSWSEITVEDFKSIRIERMTTKDTAWTTVANIEDAFVTSYNDTITDDEDLLYRVGIVDVQEDIVWAEGSTNIPRTTATTVPTEFSTIQPAFDSDLIDSGDTIYVKSRIYTETLGIFGKDVLIKSLSGYQNTILQPTFTEDPNKTMRVLNIGSGVLDGFTIELGKPSHEQNGGGVSIAQNATVQNCYITGNQSFGLGGGVYITDNGNLYNCIVTGDTATAATGMFIISAHGEIINNTIAFNSLKGDDIVIDGPCSGLVFRNNIVKNPYSAQDIRFAEDRDTTGVIMDYLLLDNPINFGSNIIIADPQFTNNVDFELLPGSPAIDSGHPDQTYEDVDGTRNDIGAYGGPLNNK